jgi:hypothetical protein
MAHLHSWGLLALAAAGCQGEELESPITGTDAAIAIDTAVDTAANADLPTEQVSPCVYDWIVPAEDPVYQASLPVEAPKVLWSIDIDGSPGRTSAGLLLAGDHLVAWPDGRIVFVSKDGTPTEVLAATTTAPWSPATADKDGNIYIVSHGGIRSLKPDGSVRWSIASDSSSVPCPPNSELCSAPRYPAPVLSSDGILFVVGPGAFLSALDSSSGTTLWRVSTPLDYYQVAADVLGGGGKHLLLRQMSQGWSHFTLLDKDRGTTVGQVERTCYGLVPSVLGWTMASMCRDGAEYYGGCPALVDPSGLDWADSRPSAYLTVPGERLLATILVANKDGSEDPRALVAYNRDGTLAAGPWPTQGGLLAVVPMERSIWPSVRLRATRRASLPSLPTCSNCGNSICKANAATSPTGSCSTTTACSTWDGRAARCSG